MNATSRVQGYLNESAARLRAWQDQHLSVEAQSGLKPELRAPRLVASFPPAPREYRGLCLRTGLGGARRS